MINEEYNVNISLSSDLTYNILPKPHLKINNVKFYTNDLESPRELGQIKNLKVFISQKNLFKQEEIKINKISLNKSNFLFHQKDIIYLNKFIKKKFSKKKLEINNSKFFYMDNNDNVISIFPVSKFTLFYDEENFKNFLISKGEFFTIPYTLKWSKNFNNNLNSTFLKLKKLNLKLENFSEEKNSGLLIKNFIFFRSSEIETDIIVKKDSIKIKSAKDTKINNNNLSYESKIDLNPFNLTMDINIEKIDFKKNIFNNNLLRSLFELDNFYNKNLSSKIYFKIKNLKKNKLFDSSKIVIHLNNGNINFNNTIFNGKIGSLNLVNSSIQNFKDDLIFDGNFKFKIISKNEFYRLFQITKKNRKKINNIYFDIQYNLTKNMFKIRNLTFDPGSTKNEDELLDFLGEGNYRAKINNWIDFKNFINKIFSDYYEG